MIKENKKKILKDEVYHFVRNDMELRKKIANSLAISDNSVYRYGVRKSPTLSKPVVLEIIRNHFKVKLEDLFEREIINQE